MGNQSSCHCLNLEQENHKQSILIEVQNNNVHINGNFNFQRQSTFKKLQVAASELCISSGIGLLYNQIVMRLLAYKQENILKAFSILPSRQNRIQLMNRISEINFDQMDSLYQNLILNQDRRKFLMRLMNNQRDYLGPCSGFDVNRVKQSDKYDLMNRGYQLLGDKKVAIVLMCAGASSRFYFQDKFMYKFEYLEQTSLLAILFQKLRTNLKAKHQNQIIKQTIFIIGNQNNINKIQNYMKQNQFFYFQKQNVYFTEIPSQPILDENGKICLNFQYNHIRRPKGSAYYIQTLLLTDAFQILQQQQIQYLHFVGTQNLAQSPGDPLFLGLTHTLKRQISIKCTDPKTPYENFDRIIASHSSKIIYVVDKDALQTISETNFKIRSSPIAMNSMIFSLGSLKQINKNLYGKLEQTYFYRSSIIQENYYDFCRNKPIMSKKCYYFEKDIKDFIHCSKAPLVLKVGKNYFNPIITLNHQYSVKQACEKYNIENKKISL